MSRRSDVENRIEECRGCSFNQQEYCERHLGMIEELPVEDQKWFLEEVDVEVVELWECKICDSVIVADRTSRRRTSPDATVHALSHEGDTATIRNPQKIMWKGDMK